MNGTITCVETGDVYSITSQTNGTQTLTFASGSLPLEASTTYQWWVNATDSDGWTNTSYNFTSGVPRRMSEHTSMQDNTALTVMLAIVTVLVVVIGAMRTLDGKVTIKELIGLVITVAILIAVMGFI